MPGPEREACFHCGEPALREARLCPHCRQPLLVDVRLHAPVTDARRRYQFARALTALGPSAPPFAALQAALQTARPVLLRGVTRAEADRAVQAAAGFEASVEPASGARPAAGALARPRVAAAWLAAAAVALAVASVVWWRARPSAPPAPVPAAQPSAPAPASPAEPELAPRQIAARVVPSLVSLRCSNSVGAGFFVDDELLLTNAHVLCRDGDALSVVFRDGRTLPGGVVRRDEALDLALVRVPGVHAPALPLGDAGELALGDRVLAAGSPMGLEFSVSEGLVSNLDQVIFGVAYVQTDAKINPGNSGGPLLDRRGRVVGVVSLKHAQAEGVAWALPINYAYSGAQPFVGAGARPPSDGWEAMLARAERANREARTEIAALDLRPGLVGARLDQYQRLVARVLQPARTDPGYTDVKFKVWSGDDVVCTLGGAVKEWKVVERNAGDEGERRYWAWLESNGLDARLYVGEAAMSWNFCPHDRLATRGAVLELEGADPQAAKLRLR